MRNIEIDFDVFKELTMRRASEDITYNDVLRELLELPPKKNPMTSANSVSGLEGWLTKGVRFPNGTDFRGNYKGKKYFGKVKDGRLWVDNENFDSPSAAARKITDNSVNGWLFWECRMPDEESWQIIKSLQK